MNDTAKKARARVLVHHWCGIHVPLVLKQSWKPSLTKFWPLPSGQKLKTSHKILFPAAWSSYSHYTCRPFPFGRNNSNSMDLKIGCNSLGSNISWLSSNGLFPWELVKDQVYRTSVLTLIQLKRKITRAIRDFSQKTINNDWINWKNWLCTVIRESGGHVEIQWHSIKTVSIEC